MFEMNSDSELMPEPAITFSHPKAEDEALRRDFKKGMRYALREVARRMADPEIIQCMKMNELMNAVNILGRYGIGTKIDINTTGATVQEAKAQLFLEMERRVRAALEGSDLNTAAPFSKLARFIEAEAKRESRQEVLGLPSDGMRP